MVLRQALMLAGAGAAIGLLAAELGTRSMQGLLHGVAALNVATFGGAALALLALTMTAAWQPARRAERVDPVETLKAE